MSTIGDGMQSFIPTAIGREKQRNTEPETYNLSLRSRAEGSSLVELDNSEDLKSRGESLAQTSMGGSS